MKNSLLILIKILLSGVLLYLISLKIDWYQLTVAIRQSNFIYLFIGSILGCGFNMVKFLKWHNLIRAGNYHHSYWDGAKSYMIGNSLGLVTPMRAGDLGRALYFSSTDRTRIMGLTIMDRLVDLVIVLILSIGGGFILINKGFGMLIIILAFSGLFLLYSAKSLHGIFRRIIPSGILGQKMSKIIDIFKLLDIGTISITLILSLISFLLSIFQFYCLLSALEDSSLLLTCLAAPLITLASVLPISFMGLGVREGTSILLLSKFGVSAPAALAAAFLCFLINNVSISIIGVIYISKVKVEKKI